MPDDMLSGTKLREALDGFLPRVSKPARYLGLERNLVRKPWDSVAVRVALAFPDAYEIGMSHQGSQILYNLVNRRPDALAERTYAPWPDMAEAMRTAGVPLYTLESYTPLRLFDVVGISLQTELNYVNVPYLLDLAGIPRRAAQRQEDDPLILGGGPCTANPEPLADLFDAFLIGDAEAGLDALLDALRDARQGGASRPDLLRRLARLPGVYVPGLYRWAPGEGDSPAGWTAEDEAARLPVARVWVEELDPEAQPERPIVPFAEVIQDRLGLEIMRGCTRGCRFCQAGYWYRPTREHDPDFVIERLERQVDATGFAQVGLLSLSTTDYSQVEPTVRELAGRMEERRVSLSLPSLRADSLSVELAHEVSRVRKSGFTFAPETGSDRLRRVINKSLSNQDMLRAAEAVFARGWNLIKLYAMVGLPTETDEDLEELVSLVAELVSLGRRVRGRRVEVKVSVGCFVPKPWTPFQWQPFAGVEELQRRIDLLKDRFRRIRGVRLTWSDPETAALEALLSRGDRRLGATIERAHDLGAVFDGWTDQLDLEAWRQAYDATGVDMERQLGPRAPDAALPWDVIDAGVRKGFLRAEWRRALKEEPTEDCKWGTCYRCGIPGDGEDIRLARPASAAAPTPRDQGAPTPPAKARSVQRPVYRRYRVVFAKQGDARFLSHRLVMDALERALRAARAPVRFTEGFNPHIKLSMGPALALGHEGLAEAFDVDCTAPLRPHHVDAANGVLPEGLQLLEARGLLPGASSLGKTAAAARYRIAPLATSAWPADPTGLAEEIRTGILDWSVLPDGGLRVSLNLRRPEGPTPGVKDLLAAVGVPEDEIRMVRVTREMVQLRPPARKRKE